LHAAQRKGRGYTVVLSSLGGSIHPGSSLHLNQILDGDSVPDHPWVIFGELFRSARTFLTMNTPIDPVWLREAPPEGKPREEFQKLLASRSVEQREIAITSGALNELIGRRACKIPELERMTGATIEADFEPPRLVLFASCDRIAVAVDFIEKEVSLFMMNTCIQVEFTIRPYHVFRSSAFDERYRTVRTKR
jgi:hypothetical protein